MKRLKTALGVLSSTLALTLMTSLGSAHAADTWPDRPVHLIVGFAAGSSPDVQARMIAPALSKALGQPVVVDNKPGAAANIGAAAVAHATDNHTFGIIGNGPLTSSQFLYPNLNYDPAKDFAPLALIATAPMVWIANKEVANGTPQDFIKKLQDSGDSMAFGSVGAGSATHLGAELLKRALKVDPIHVPYNGGPAVISALIGGQIQMALLPVSTARAQIDAGKVAAIAVVSAKRSPLLPQLPGLEDLGIHGINIEVWNAFMAPTSMPKENQERLSKALQQIIGSDEIHQNLLAQGWQVGDPSPAALTARIEHDRKTYQELISQVGIKLN